MMQRVCAACRGDVPPVRPSQRYLDMWDARVRATLGKAAVPVMNDLPADVRAFVGGL